MAIVGTVQELPDSPSGDFQEFKHTLTRKFLVQTSSFNDGPLHVTGAIGIPRMFSIYSTPGEYHLFARARDISADRAGPNSLFWYVTVKYSTPEPYGRDGNKRENPNEDQNPLLKIPNAEVHFENFQQPIYWIYNVSTGLIQPITASNCQVYVPAPVKDTCRMMLSITTNEDIFSNHPATGLQYMNSVNADVFWGLAPGTVRCMGITANTEHKQLPNGSQYAYLKVVYQFCILQTHDLILLDAGTYYLKCGSGGSGSGSGSGLNCNNCFNYTKFPFTTATGTPCEGPLDGMGGQGDPANPKFNTYRVYPRLAFGLLQLPQNFPQCA